MIKIDLTNFHEAMKSMDETMEKMDEQMRQRFDVDYTISYGWQCCPVCNGIGAVPARSMSYTEEKCPQCEGKRIISIQTGKPPEFEIVDSNKPAAASSGSIAFAIKVLNDFIHQAEAFDDDSVSVSSIKRAIEQLQKPM